MFSSSYAAIKYDTVLKKNFFKTKVDKYQKKMIFQNLKSVIFLKYILNKCIVLKNCCIKFDIAINKLHESYR